MEKITKYKNLIRIIHELYCDKCQCPMKYKYAVSNWGGTVYHYGCPKCGEETDKDIYYPWDELIGNKYDEEIE